MRSGVRSPTAPQSKIGDFGNGRRCLRRLAPLRSRRSLPSWMRGCPVKPNLSAVPAAHAASTSTPASTSRRTVLRALPAQPRATDPPEGRSHRLRATQALGQADSPHHAPDRVPGATLGADPTPAASARPVPRRLAATFGVAQASTRLHCGTNRFASPIRQLRQHDCTAEQIALRLLSANRARRLSRSRQ